MSNSDKSFDAVAMMRAIRIRLNRELAGKSFEQQQRYIQEHIQHRGPDPESGLTNAVQGTDSRP